MGKMKGVLGLITTIAIVATSGPIFKNLHYQVKVESLKKVNQGLGPLLTYTKQLNKK